MFLIYLHFFYNFQSTQNNTIIKKIKLLVSLPLLALTCNYANATNNVQETDFKIISAETSSPQPQQSVKKRPQSKTTAKNRTAADKVYDVSSLMPQFPGGMDALSTFIKSSINYPETAISKGVEGKVTVSFIVEKNGTVTNATVVTPVDPDLDNEAVRVVGNMPKWTPGTLNGAPVRVKYSIPVRFSLPKSTTTPFVSERERLKKEWKAIDEKYDAKYQNDSPSATPTLKIVGAGKSNKTNMKQIKGNVYDVVEQMPNFPGGPSALSSWLSQNVKYPVVAQENGVQGRVVVRFIVEKDGKITNTEVVMKKDPSLDFEAERVVRSMPNWTPGKQNGKPVRVMYNIPVSFRLQ